MPNYSINSQEIKSLSASGFDLVPSGIQLPDVIDVPFHFLINQAPVVVGQQEHPLVVRLGHDQQVVGFTLYPVLAATGNLTDYTLLSLDQTKAQLSQETKRLISVEPLGYGTSPASNVASSVNLTSIELAYYFSSTNNLLYPSYLLKGQGSFSDGSQAILTFLLPALNPGYYE